MPNSVNTLPQGQLFVANFAYWQDAGYFDQEALSKPLLHLWSLAVEEQFYIFWPLLLSVIWTRSRRATIAITLIIIIISFAFNVQTLKTDPAASFYLPFGRLWELLLGACLTFLNISKWTNQRQLNWVSAAGFALVLISVFAFGSMSPYPGLRGMPPYPGLRPSSRRVAPRS